MAMEVGLFRVPTVVPDPQFCGDMDDMGSGYSKRFAKPRGGCAGRTDSARYMFFFAALAAL
jgi:hypothetical protein